MLLLMRDQHVGDVTRVHALSTYFLRCRSLAITTVGPQVARQLLPIKALMPILRRFY